MKTIPEDIEIKDIRYGSVNILPKYKKVTVGNLIDQLSKFDKDKEVTLSCVGFGMSDSYDFDLPFGESTVDEFKNKVRIHYSNYV